MCVCVWVLRLGVLSKNTHTWCVSSSRANRWEERTSKLVAPIWEGRMTGDLCLFLIQSFFFLLFISSEECFTCWTHLKGNQHYLIWSSLVILCLLNSNDFVNHVLHCFSHQRSRILQQTHLFVFLQPCTLACELDGKQNHVKCCSNTPPPPAKQGAGVNCLRPSWCGFVLQLTRALWCLTGTERCCSWLESGFFRAGARTIVFVWRPWTESW